MESAETTLESAPHQFRPGSQAGRVTVRDRHLMALLATARYLTGEQLKRTAFGGREEAARKRLLALSGADNQGPGPKFLRRIFFRTFEGNRVAVWALREAGYCVAERVLGPVKRPQGEVGANFLEHAIALNELLVRLATARLPATHRTLNLGPHGARRLPPFVRLPLEGIHWVPSDSAKLPWTEYQPAADAVRQRVIQPDAVLELPSLGRRLFVECEMGTHSVVAESDEKSGATMAKVERYQAFLTGFADVDSRTTFYGRTYPDGFAPEVLFLVQTSSRAKTIEAAVAHWRRQGTQRRTPIHAWTVDVATAEILKGLGHPVAPASAVSTAALRTPSSSSGPPLKPEDLEALRRFYVGTCAKFKAMRDSARAQSAPVPDYPPATGEVSELLARLGLLKLSAG